MRLLESLTNVLRSARAKLDRRYLDAHAAGRVRVVAGRSDGDGRVWHLPTVPARTTREVLDLIADAAGRPLQIDNLDEPRPYGPFDATMMAEYADMFYQHTTPVDMDSSAFASAFGVAPTPLAEGIAATVDWYRGLMRT
jgi:nucleoside-diphosphate-sugar epimerase